MVPGDSFDRCFVAVNWELRFYYIGTSRQGQLDDIASGNFQKDQTIKEPIKCNICGFTFKIKSQLYGHITSMHGDEKPLKVHRDTQHFKCEVCQTVFSKKSDMEVHVSMVHEEKKPYRCGMCGVKYAEKHPLHR